MRVLNTQITSRHAVQVIGLPPPSYRKKDTYYGHTIFEDAKMHWMRLDPIQKLSNSSDKTSLVSRWIHMKYVWELTIARYLHANHVRSGNQDPEVPFALDPRFSVQSCRSLQVEEWAVSVVGHERCRALKTSNRQLAQEVERIYIKRVLCLLKPDYMAGKPKMGKSDAEKAAERAAAKEAAKAEKKAAKAATRSISRKDRSVMLFQAKTRSK